MERIDCELRLGFDGELFCLFHGDVVRSLWCLLPIEYLDYLLETGD